jgi:uncharacterized protein with LGFP repeats
MHASRGGDVNSDQESPIYEYYLAHGGAAGMLGTPTSDEETSPGADPGRHRHFCGTVYGRVHGISIHASRDKVPASCHRPDVSGTPVEATVAWSEETGAHAVLGEIRALWLELGAEGGRLGYPVSDELPTSDGRGRRTRFQFGEIWWHPAVGVAVTMPTESRFPVGYRQSESSSP